MTRRNPFHGPYVAIVGIDLAPDSRAVLDAAVEQAALHGGTVVHVVFVDEQSHVTADDLYENSFAERRATALQRLRRMGDRALRHFRARGKACSIEVVRAHYRVGNPARELTVLAQHIDADILIVGTQGRRGFRRLMQGSEAESTLRRATCPVLVVRPSKVPRRSRGRDRCVNHMNPSVASSDVSRPTRYMACFEVDQPNASRATNATRDALVPTRLEVATCCPSRVVQAQATPSAPARRPIMATTGDIHAKDDSVSSSTRGSEMAWSFAVKLSIFCL